MFPETPLYIWLCLSFYACTIPLNDIIGLKLAQCNLQEFVPVIERTRYVLFSEVKYRDQDLDILDKEPYLCCSVCWKMWSTWGRGEWEHILHQWGCGQHPSGWCHCLLMWPWHWTERPGSKVLPAHWQLEWTWTWVHWWALKINFVVSDCVQGRFIFHLCWAPYSTYITGSHTWSWSQSYTLIGSSYLS